MDVTVATLVTVFAVAVVPLVPTEPVLVGLGVLAATSHSLPVSIIAVAAVGCSISDHVLYAVGRYPAARGLSWFVRRPAGAAVEGLLTRSVTKWGASILVAGRFLPGGGTVSAVLAGVSRWHLRRFTPASLAGSAIWSAYATLVGYFGGAVTKQPAEGLLLSFGMAVAVAGITTVLVRRTRREQEQSETEEFSMTAN